MAIIYGLKVNLSVAMVAMLNHSALAKIAADALEHGHGHEATTNVVVEEVCKGSGNGTEVVEVRNKNLKN